MRVLNLKRTHRTVDGAFGILDVDGEPFCVTVELPWRNNARDISHIPVGEYLCEKGMSEARGYEVFWVRNVENRENIQIHIGNTIHDIQGCIVVGHGFGKINVKDAGLVHGVQESRLAFGLLMMKMNEETQFKLVISEV